MTARSILRSLAPVALLALATPCLAQDPAGPADEEDSQVVELRTTLVEVPTVVSAPGGRYVTDLSEADFTVLEDGVRQDIALFAAVDEPFNVAVMLDCSGSTREQLDRIKAAAHAFVDQLRPEDRVAVVTFEDEVRVAAPLTGDRAALRRAIESIRTGAYTQVYEAVHTVADEVFAGVRGRKAAILFSDGVDTASEIADFDGSLNEIAAGNVIVYPIRYSTIADVERRVGLGAADAATSRPRRVSGAAAGGRRQSIAEAYRVADSYLSSLAEDTGGVLHRADTLDDLPEAFRRIAAELRHQYLLGYYPADPGGDDRERSITVRVSRPGVTVRGRSGYRPARPTP